jgi:hypothetical protein
MNFIYLRRRGKFKNPLLIHPILLTIFLERSIIWDISTFRQLKGNQPFVGIYRFNLQGLRMIQARIQQEEMRASYLNPLSSLSIDSFQHSLKITVFWNKMLRSMVGLHLVETFLEMLAPLCHRLTPRSDITEICKLNTHRRETLIA